MPKVGMEPIRKAALVKATIVEIGRAGSLDVTVSQIAKRAGMSSALVTKNECLVIGMVMPTMSASWKASVPISFEPT